MVSKFSQNSILLVHFAFTFHSKSSRPSKWASRCTLDILRSCSFLSLWRQTKFLFSSWRHFDSYKAKNSCDVFLVCVCCNSCYREVSWMFRCSLAYANLFKSSIAEEHAPWRWRKELIDIYRIPATFLTQAGRVFIQARPHVEFLIPLNNFFRKNKSALLAPNQAQN